MKLNDIKNSLADTVRSVRQVLVQLKSAAEQTPKRKQQIALLTRMGLQLEATSDTVFSLQQLNESEPEGVEPCMDATRPRTISPH